jgi:DNA invertase Pin-like site-specific DNA recombinase
LEQDFNSLNAQRESCEAYIKSQRLEGWTVLPTTYDDGGYSGGTMERPALKELLGHVQSGAVDVVVVYKVDRLTRSLSDFAKIVEVFDKAGASFVSVTQQFNTTTSMGRLTLNVLLSFAQFEREVTGERIRDKIAASKKKGMWMGGWVPLGYDRKDRSLVVNEVEAKTVRTIFDLFLELKNVRAVQSELARLNLRTKPYAVQRGRAAGNLAFARGHIYKILSNPIYIGEIDHKGVRHRGQHPPLVSRRTWDAVQAQLAENRHANRARSNAKSTNLLAGTLYDESGNRLVSSHTAKNGKRYRYYVAPEENGRAPAKSNTVKPRLPAPQIDELVVVSLQRFLDDRSKLATRLRSYQLTARQISNALGLAHQLAGILASNAGPDKQRVIADLVERVVVSNENMQIRIRSHRFVGATLPQQATSGVAFSIDVPFTQPERTGLTKLLIEEHAAHNPDPVITKAVARAHRWFEELTTGAANSMAEIAARENLTDNYISNLIHLAWLSPQQIELVLQGDPQATAAARTSMLTRARDPLWPDHGKY